MATVEQSLGYILWIYVIAVGVVIFTAGFILGALIF